MPNANVPKERIKLPGVVGANTTLTASESTRITAGGSKSLRVDVGVGSVTVAAAVSAKLQDSSGFNLWNDVKSVSITGSTDQSVTAVDTGTDRLTINTHGYVDGEAVAVTGTELPGGLYDTKVYYVRSATTNDFQLSETQSGPAVNLTSAGSSVTVTAVRQFSITVQQEVAGDQTLTPLRGAGRVQIITGAGDSCQVLSVIYNQED